MINKVVCNECGRWGPPASTMNEAWGTATKEGWQMISGQPGKWLCDICHHRWGSLSVALKVQGVPKRIEIGDIVGYLEDWLALAKADSKTLDEVRLYEAGKNTWVITVKNGIVRKNPAHTVVCSECGRRSSQGFTPNEAKNRATKEGWVVIQRRPKKWWCDTCHLRIESE